MCLVILPVLVCVFCFFFFQAEDGIRDWSVTGVQTCALPIYGTHKVKAEFTLLLVLPLLVSVSFFLIADIDSPRGGAIHVNPQNLVSLAQSLDKCRQGQVAAQVSLSSTPQCGAGGGGAAGNQTHCQGCVRPSP